MRIIFLDTRRLGCGGLEVLLTQGHEVVAAFTADNAIAEGRTADDYGVLCARHGAALHVTDRLERKPYPARFAEWCADLIVSLFWKRLVGAQLLQTAASVASTSTRRCCRGVAATHR